MVLPVNNAVIRGARLKTPFLLAPMAGISHSAFRRLAADFGGYGALYTEMLSAPALANENLCESPFTKKRAEEGPVIYQLVLVDHDTIGNAMRLLTQLDPFGIDINLGCSAPEIRKRAAGIELFDDRERLKMVLDEARRCWSGILTVKCRLGKPADDWEQQFLDRLRIIQESGVDAITVHPRFSNEKLKRRSRHSLFSWIASNTSLPLFANGDIFSVSDAGKILAAGSCAGCMIGRMAAVKPWIFRELTENRAPEIDYAEVWGRFCRYVNEDFRPERAIGRIKQFAAYFARNFFFGHELYRRAQGAPDLSALQGRVAEFLDRNPPLANEPSVAGI